MPLEVGGRGDKQGNRYEIKWCINQILKVLDESNKHIIIEPLGDIEQGIDLVVMNKDDKLELQQCKSSNKALDSWAYNTLNTNGILNNWKFHLDRDPNIHVSLVSPLSFPNLDHLLQRVRNTSSNPTLFFKNQIERSDKKFINFVTNFCNALGFNVRSEDESHLQRMLNYLSRIHYRQSPDTERSELILEKINLLFQGDMNDIYDAFVSWIFDGDTWGKEIDINLIDAFLKDKNIRLKDIANDERVYPRIQKLNRIYKDNFTPLKAGLISRSEADTCMAEIQSGNSVIIHGTAGSGKSGLTNLVIKDCEENNIPYLAIKLDKYIPKNNVEQWSKEMGLPYSLEHCINSIATNKNAVIILDQLDALRWTSQHSNHALQVCSELIRNVSFLNNERDRKISIIFVCRTYDFQNDNNIKSLFSKKKDLPQLWKNIEVGKLTNKSVENIIGVPYRSLTNKLKELLRLPNNLYMWQQLKNTQGLYEISTTNHLVTEWWKQIIAESIDSNISERELNTFKRNILKSFETTGKLFALSSELDVNDSTITYLISSGFIIEQDAGRFKKISFIHQSLYDCFLADEMFLSLNSGMNIIELIGSKEIQTPTRRYQIQMLMQNLFEGFEDDFLQVGQQILQAPSIRFAFKFIFLELLNQVTNPSEQMKTVVLKLIDDEDIGSHVISTAIRGNKAFISLLIEDGRLDEWITTGKKDLVIDLLQSINGNHSQENVDFMEKYIFTSNDDIVPWLRCFPYDISDDSDALFKLRMKLYHTYPKYIETYLDVTSLFKNFEMRAVDIIRLICNVKSVDRKRSRLADAEDVYLDNDTPFLIQNGKQVLNKLLPLIPIGTDPSLEYSNWREDLNNNTIERTVIKIIKKANLALINQDSSLFFEMYADYLGKGYTLFNEVILDGLLHLPSPYSNEIIMYLTKDIEKNMFSFSRNDRLKLSQDIIKKHLYTCDKTHRDIFINKIISYFPKNTVERYKRRIQYNAETEKIRVFWNFWGEFQYVILNLINDEYLNTYALNLKQVLNRKFQSGTYPYKMFNYQVGTVVSAISNKNLSIQNWKKILLSKKLMNRENGNRWNDDFTENTLETFSSDFSNAVKKQTLELTTLVLGIDKVIDEAFIDALYSGISRSENINDLPSEMIAKLIERHPSSNESYRANNICHIIAKHSEVNWPNNVIQTIKDIAINHTNPEPHQSVVISNDDNEMRSASMLRTNAINCARGTAAQTLGDLLWSDKNLFYELQEVVLKLTKDPEPAVRYASLFALWPIYNINKTYACENILKLYQDDIRNVAFPDSIRMLFYLYENNQQEVLDIIIKCFASEDKELIKVGSYAVTEMYIHKNEFVDIFTDVSLLTEEQAFSILLMVTKYFEFREHVQIAKEIILKFHSSHYDLERTISGLLHDETLDMKRDQEFLHLIFKSKYLRKLASQFNKYIEKQAQPITDFADLIFELSYSLIKNPNALKDSWGAEDEISKMIIGLYDEVSDLYSPDSIAIANECLDIWDLMFEKQIGVTRALSFNMMER